MKLSALFAIQFLIVILIVGTSIQSQQAQAIRHSVKQVLGARYIAQEAPQENPPPDQTSTQDTTQEQTQSSPSDQTPPSTQNLQNQSVDNNTLNPAPDAPTGTGNSRGDQSAPAAAQTIQQPSNQPLQTDETSLINQNPTPLEGQSAQITPYPASASDQTQTSDIQVQEKVNTENNTSSPINQTAIDFETTVNKPETIDTATISKAEQEDKKIQEIKDPQQQTEALINFAKDKVVDLNQKILGNDFSTTSFLIQRLSDQIGKAQENLQQVSPVKGNLTEKQLKTFCKQADLGLKTEQLVVPEELEQDFEITRGSCLNTQ